MVFACVVRGLTHILALLASEAGIQEQLSPLLISLRNKDINTEEQQQNKLNYLELALHSSAANLHHTIRN